MNLTSHPNFKIFLKDRQAIENYEMPQTLNWRTMDELYDITPTNYEDLISQKGVGPSLIRALSLISEIIYGNRASWKDPVKYNYAHGGKDGVPYPIARNTYDKSIKYLSEVISGSKIEKKERISSLKRLLLILIFYLIPRIIIMVINNYYLFAIKSLYIISNSIYSKSN